MKKESRPNGKWRLFRFLVSWLTHKDFPTLMQKVWDRSPLGHPGPYSQKALQKWNKEVCGNIFDQKRDLISRLEEVSHNLTVLPSVSLDNAHKALYQEYEQVLLQEEILWYQMSRAKWIHQGERNTRFFHGVTGVRRNKNTYEMLQNNEGEWIGDQDQLEQMGLDYFNSETFSPTMVGGRQPVLWGPSQNWARQIGGILAQQLLVVRFLIL